MAKRLWDRSILFEIARKDSPSKIVEAFTLNIPPESSEITFPQRVSRTFTFGGVFEDDYGLGNETIVISGTTGGKDVYEIYRRTLGNQEYDGKSTIYEFRERIIRYKRNYPDYDKYEIRIYDLSARPDGIGDANNLGYSDGYVVSLDDFQITRSSSRPLFYNYRLDLFVLRPLGVKIVTLTRTIPKIERSALLQIVDSLRAGFAAIDNFFGGIEGIAGQLDSAVGLLADIEGKLRTYIDRTERLIRYPGELAKKLVNNVRALRDLVFDIPTTATSLWESLGEDWNDVWEQTKQLVSGSSYLVSYGKTPDASSATILDRSTGGSDTGYGIDQPDGQSQTITVYGRQFVAVPTGIKLESIALSAYGDPDYAKIIADYNGITSNSDLSAGQILAIPVIDDSREDFGNQVFDVEGRDFHGTDISIAGGELVILDSGDYGTISGKENLLQSITMRLSEDLGGRLRDTTYGITQMIGMANVEIEPATYIATAIRDTVMQDPRVREITGLRFRGEGDKLFVNFDFTSNAGENITYQGVL
jgi:hypothetical protein